MPKDGECLFRTQSLKSNKIINNFYFFSIVNINLINNILPSTMSIKISFESETLKDNNKTFSLEYNHIDELPDKLQTAEQIINTYLTELLTTKEA